MLGGLRTTGSSIFSKNNGRIKNLKEKRGAGGGGGGIKKKHHFLCDPKEVYPGVRPRQGKSTFELVIHKMNIKHVK